MPTTVDKHNSVIMLSATMMTVFISGVLLSRQQVERASQLCEAAGCWLVLDNTYEHFVYDGREHFCLAAPHVINIFSFSKVREAVSSLGGPKRLTSSVMWFGLCVCLNGKAGHLLICASCQPLLLQFISYAHCTHCHGVPALNIS